MTPQYRPLKIAEDTQRSTFPTGRHQICCGGNFDFGFTSSDAFLQVGRLVQLMQKFSKKLVSKVIYVKILLASHPDLLEHFLKEKGWELR